MLGLGNTVPSAKMTLAFVQIVHLGPAGEGLGVREEAQPVVIPRVRPQKVGIVPVPVNKGDGGGIDDRRAIFS